MQRGNRRQRLIGQDGKEKLKRKDEEPAQQGQRSFQPAEITSFIPYEKGRAHREFVPFLLKIILIYRNVCTVLKQSLLVSRMLLTLKTCIYIKNLRGVERHQLCHVLLQAIEYTRITCNPGIVA